MDKDIIWFAENMCGLNLTENHKEILLAFQEAKDRGQKIFINCGRIQGKGLLREIFYSFENWLKDQTIADLEAKLAEKEINITNEEFEKEVEKTYQKINQDKISFAVEQLEKVKEGLMRYAGAICNEDGSIKKYDYVIKDSDFEKHIDNQIKQLKEGK